MLGTGCIAGFIAETIQGVGGAVTLADGVLAIFMWTTAQALPYYQVDPVISGYLSEVYKLVAKHGGVCISDEVQTGFGRTGSNFWGFSNHSVMPDIVTMAKVCWLVHAHCHDCQFCKIRDNNDNLAVWIVLPGYWEWAAIGSSCHDS